MKLVTSNLKKGMIKVKIDDLEDLWYLSTLIEQGDLVKGKTLRKIKIGQSTDRNQKVVKKSIFMTIRVEKVEFENNVLRVGGKITAAPEDVPLGSHHTFTVEEHTIISIIKEKWLHYQLDKIKEACQESKKKIMVLVHDREEAYFALIKKYGFELLSSIKGTVQKKADLDKTKSSFYKDVLDKLEHYDKKYELNQIIIGSPAFWKEELMKEYTNKQLKKKFIFATCSSVDENGINEVLKRPEVKEALKQDRFSREINAVDELLVEIKKNNLGVYGYKEVKNAAEGGAIANLLITDKFINDSREKGKYGSVDYIMRAVEGSKGNIVIVSSDHEGGKKLNGLGGIGGLLRYKLNY